MQSAEGIINFALRALGVLELGSTASAVEQSDALDALNVVIGSLSDEGLVIPSLTSETLTFVSSANSYTIGVGGDLQTSWPMIIESMRYSAVGANDSCRVTQTTLLRIRDSASTMTVAPSEFYYNPSYPLGVIELNTQAETGATVMLDSLKPLNEITSLFAPIALPPGYQRLLKWALASELFTEYGHGDPAVILSNAHQAKQTLIERIGASRVPLVSCSRMI